MSPVVRKGVCNFDIIPRFMDLHDEVLESALRMRCGNLGKTANVYVDTGADAKAVVKEMVYGTDSHTALRDKVAYTKIIIKEPSAYVGGTLMVFNPWGLNNISIVCLDEGFGFHSTASGVSLKGGYGDGPGEWDAREAMVGNNERVIQSVFQSKPGYHEHARAAHNWTRP